MGQEPKATPEQELMIAIGEIRARGEETDDLKSREIADWEPDVDELKKNRHMLEIHYAEMSDYILYVSVPKASTLARMPPGTSRMSWSIHTMPANELVSGGSAESVEQGKKFAEIGYQAIYGAWRGDA